MAQESNNHNTFQSPILEYRIKQGISRAQLAERLGVHAVTIYRWEVGITRPPKPTLERLESLELGAHPSLSLTDVKTIPRLRQEALLGRDAQDVAAELEKQAEINLESEVATFTAMPSPWVRNGPPDQNDFHKAMIVMQTAGLSSLSPDTLAHRFSMLESIQGQGKTAQFLLEKPKPVAMSWNSNYGSHGWHRYVGRFPPHVVRSLLNRFGASPKTVVCDPFVGSGTTAVECRLLGIPFVGIEICPLSCLMSRTKATFPVDSSAVDNIVAKFKVFFEEKEREFTNDGQKTNVTHDEVLARRGNLIPSFPNIGRWFTPQALLGVSIALDFGSTLRGFARDAFLLALSAKMRSIGNVDVDVVRAEYSRRPRADVDVVGLVSQQLSKMARDIEGMHESHRDLIGDSASISIQEGSVLDIELPSNSVDHVITSPPYGVEAISYLRTHLLSYRTLISELGHDPYETRDKTIGSEYTPPSKSYDVGRMSPYSRTFEAFFGSLIVDKSLIDRRDAMMQFFEDIHSVGQKLARWLKNGGFIAFIVGNKRLGSTVIPADQIVVEMFDSIGLRHVESIRHKLKTNNSNSSVPWQDRIIDEEAILIFKKGTP